MTLEWKESVSANAATAIIRDITSYTICVSDITSPIDSFYMARNQLLMGVSPDYATKHPRVVALVLVGLISETENYFRNVISGVIKICPLAKNRSATKNVNLATAWHGFDNIEKGAFENISFSSAETVLKTLKEIVGYEVKESSQMHTPLYEFDKLCELRHAVVHSGGFLAGKNAVRLQLPSSKHPYSIHIGFSELQGAAEVCSALVCAANLELFVHLARRWLHEWPKTPTYEDTNLTSAFNMLWKLFFSKSDHEKGLIKHPLSSLKVRNRIIKTNAK